MKLLSYHNAGATKKAMETGNGLILNGVWYNKNDMSIVPFLPFTDGGSGIAFNGYLSSKNRTDYWNTRSMGNILMDNNDNQMYHIFQPYNVGGTAPGTYSYLCNVTDVIEKKSTNGQWKPSYSNYNYYKYGSALTQVLGKSSYYYFTMHLEGSYEYSSSHSYYPTTSSNPIRASLAYIEGLYYYTIIFF